MQCPTCQRETETCAAGTCATCDHHFPLGNHGRVDLLFAPGSFRETFADLVMSPGDAVRYGENCRLHRERALQKTGLLSACLTGRGTVDGVKIVFVGLDFAFLGGSFDPVVTDRIHKQMAEAQESGIPVLFYVSSTGPDVHFGVLGRRNAVNLARLIAETSVPTVAVLTHVVAGGALFCFAACDYVIAEPGAAIISQGANLVADFETAQGATLPEGFQTAEYSLHRAIVDSIVCRDQLREHVARHLPHAERSPGQGPGPDGQAGLTTDPDAVPTHDPWALYEELSESSPHTLPSLVTSVIESGTPSFGYTSGRTPSTGSVFSYLGAVSGLPLLGIGLGKRDMGRDRLGSPLGSLSVHDITRLDRMLAYAQKLGLPVVFFVASNFIEPSLRNASANIFREMRRLLDRLDCLSVPTATVIVGECSRLLGEIVTRTGHVLMLEKALNMLQSPENIGYKTKQTGEAVVAASHVTAKDSLEDGFVDAVCIETGREPEKIARRIRSWLCHELSQTNKPDNKPMDGD